MNRLVQKMTYIQKQNRKAFIAYIMAGEPRWDAAADIILELEKAGATAIELGVPFSDPIADGPVIQAAANRALANGVTLASIFMQVKRIRENTEIPILLMGYWNVFLQYGRRKVLEDAKESGIDGFIIADLPPEAEPHFFLKARENELCTVLLASEITPDERLKTIVKTSTGFIYYVPQLGITGLNLQINDEVKSRIKKIKTMTDEPVCIGIGVKTGEHINLLNEVADGVIVGTRIVEFIEAHRDEKNIGALVGGLIDTLIRENKIV